MTRSLTRCRATLSPLVCLAPPGLAGSFSAAGAEGGIPFDWQTVVGLADPWLGLLAQSLVLALFLLCILLRRHHPQTRFVSPWVEGPDPGEPSPAFCWGHVRPLLRPYQLRLVTSATQSRGCLSSRVTDSNSSVQDRRARHHRDLEFVPGTARNARATRWSLSE
jgi:hypothetical protein